jgi:hypothetical protein
LSASSDITGPGSFEQILYSQNTLFDPAADINADGVVDNRDLFALRHELVQSAANQSVLNAEQQLLLKRGDFNSSGTTDYLDLQQLYDNFGNRSWLFDLNVDGQVDSADVVTMLTNIFSPTPGDFTLNGYVDSADYVSWRKTSAAQNEYDLWRAHFDQPVGSSPAAVIGPHAVSEPASAGLLAISAVILYGRRLRQLGPKTTFPVTLRSLKRFHALACRKSIFV